MISSGREHRFNWLSLPVVGTAVVALALLRFYVAAHVGLSFDEGYYTFWSERLSVGYLDHPPAVAAMIAAGRALLGNNELGARLFALVAGLVTSGLLWRLGTLIADRRVAALAVLLYNTAPVAALGFIVTPDPPSVLFWTAVLWAIAEFIVSRRPVWWLVAGALAGFGLWSKYTNAFLGPGLLLFLLTSTERRQWLKLWQVWAAIVVALVVFSPVIWWNAEHNWLSFRFQGVRTVVSGLTPNVLGNIGDYLAGQLLYMAPVLFGFAAVGAMAALLRRGGPLTRGLELPVLTSLPLLAYFLFHALHASVAANWPMPVWPGLSLAGAWAILALADRHRIWAGIAIAAQLVLGLVPTALLDVQAVWRPWDPGSIDRTRETRDWPAMQQQLQALAEANGARWIATSRNYSLTGELASYFLFAGSPLPVRQVEEAARWLFLPPLDPDALGWPALFVRFEPDPAHPAPPSDQFSNSRLLAVLHRTQTGVPEEAFSVFLVSQPTPAMLQLMAQ